MAEKDPDPQGTPEVGATQAQQDLLKRMEELAGQIAPAAPAAASPPGLEPPPPPGAAASEQDMLARMAELATSMEAPKPAAPAAPAAPPAAPLPAVAAAPASAPAQDYADAVLELKAAAAQLQAAAARESESARELSAGLAEREKRIKELEARLDRPAPAVPPTISGPSKETMEALERALAELKTLVTAQTEAEQRRLAQLEVRLEQKLETAQSAPPEPGPRLETVADMVRELQASMEMMRSNLARDVSVLKARLDASISAQLSAARPAPAPAPGQAATPVFAGFTSVEDLRQELLGPMAAMKGQLMELSMSYHQLSLRLAVLAASERAGRPELLE
ncbi:MAG: hypothetical protein HY077_06255 [Elusimicrobia bacterium]|nr:hypothetical protein [Elusimicrobiota bacterium]